MEDNFKFEAGFSELEKLVSQLEKEELPLEKAIALYEKGIKISERLGKILQKAESTIKQLSRSPEGQLTLGDFAPEGEE